MIYLGDTDITGIFLGETPITKVYLGETLLWSAAPAYDPDAEAGFAAAGITDSTRKGHINTLIVGLKDAGVWARLSALYLTNQGGATANAVNWKSPGTYDLTFVGSPVHNAHSIAWNGTSQYADTGFVPSGTLTEGYGHMAYYSTTDSSEANAWDMGAHSGSNRYQLRHRQSSVGVSVLFFGNSTAVDNRNYNMATTVGFTVGIISNNELSLHKNGTELTSVGTSSSGSAFPTRSVALGASNRDTGMELFSTKACAAASLGPDMTATQAADYSTLIMNYISATNL